MDTKHMVWLGVFVGSTIGSFVPDLWGAGILSGWSLLFSTLGAFLGIYVGFKLSQ